MEDYFATTRNGHQLVDFYNPETNTLDIRSNGQYPSGVLSNLCSNGFRFEGMVCGSMEGFLQSLKQKDRDKQRQICSMKGGNARKLASRHGRQTRAQVSEEVKKEYEGRLDEIPGLFGLMKPMPGAIEAMHELQKHYDLFILSTTPWKNPSAWSDKVVWVTKYLDDVFHKRIVFTHRKDLCQGDYLIDDRGKNGTSDFAGEWIEFGSEKFPDWKSVLVYLGIVSQEHLDFIKSFNYWADRNAENLLNSMEQ